MHNTANSQCTGLVPHAVFILNGLLGFEETVCELKCLSVAQTTDFFISLFGSINKVIGALGSWLQRQSYVIC